RRLFFLATKADMDRQRAYFDHLLKVPRLIRGALLSIIENVGAVLPGVMPNLVDVSLHELLDELPEQRLEHDRRNHHVGSVGGADWRSLSLDRGLYQFYPASPAREPFQSLYKHAPLEGRRMTRAICNHAMQAWLQLNKLDREQGATPLPLILHF